LDVVSTTVHQGKTPPCTEAIIQSGIARVVVAQRDPFPLVDGRALQTLRQAGLSVDAGLLESAAQRLNAAYLKLVLRLDRRYCSLLHDFQDG
jgi:diaminohydroxyphosphoribosylaminopyrimidine deaminase/5-amino-6-(5-phosphoribosylamino)uracil reductase